MESTQSSPRLSLGQRLQQVPVRIREIGGPRTWQARKKVKPRIKRIQASVAEVAAILGAPNCHNRVELPPPPYSEHNHKAASPAADNIPAVTKRLIIKALVEVAKALAAVPAGERLVASLAMSTVLIQAFKEAAPPKSQLSSPVGQYARIHRIVRDKSNADIVRALPRTSRQIAHDALFNVNIYVNAALMSVPTAYTRTISLVLIRSVERILVENTTALLALPPRTEETAAINYLVEMLVPQAINHLPL